MIKLVPDPTFAREINVSIPGTETSEKVRFVFRWLDQERVGSLLVIAKIVKANCFLWVWQYLKLCFRTRTRATAIELLDELIVSWNGFDVEYSKENLKRLLLEYPDTRTSIFFEYFAGLREERTKN